MHYSLCIVSLAFYNVEHYALDLVEEMDRIIKNVDEELWTYQQSAALLENSQKLVQLSLLLIEDSRDDYPTNKHAGMD